MILTWRLLFAAALVVGAADVMATEDLTRKSGCFACHAVDRNAIGPSFREIAAKYRGDSAAEAMLIAKLKNGGAGSWGEIFMPPVSTVPEGDIKTLVKWILSMK